MLPYVTTARGIRSNGLALFNRRPCSYLHGIAMEILAWIGSCLFIICYIPQIVKAYVKKTVGDVSVGMWLVQWAAYTSCLWYAVYYKLSPLIFGYAMGWLMTAWFLELYRQYRR